MNAAVNSIKSLFYQPYPFYYHSGKRILLMAGILTAAVSLFIYFIQPFSYNFAEHKYTFSVISFLNGFLVGLLFLLYTGLIRGFSPHFFRERYWTLGKEVAFWIFFILITGVGNFFLRELIYDNPENFSLNFLKLEVVHSLTVGMLFLIAILTGKYIHILTTTRDKAVSWNKRVKNFREKEFENPTVTVTAESPMDHITFRLSEFLYAMVDGNYVEFHLRKKDGSSRRHITRNTLANVEKQLWHYPNILRVHRSYIVNIGKVNSVSGNAQGYKLQIEGTDDTIPVSRSYISSFDEVMNR